MRIDKFLKVSRVIKRRSVANEACDGGRVKINGKSAKPSADVRIGDIVEISFGSGKVAFRVESVGERASKGEAADMYTLLETE
jgi:ribosomal 50S subunit-recycling heat shock protein